MNEKTFRVLEFHKIIDLLSEQAGSSVAKKQLESLVPMTDLQEITEAQEETSQAVSVILAKGALPLGAFYDIEDSLHLAQKGGSLTMKQLLEIGYNLRVAARVVSFLKSDLPPIPVIRSYSDLISLQNHLEETISRAIISEDEMSDQASGELKDIRRSMVRQNEALRAKMNQILNSSENKTYLQDALVTMRGGRYVIPVKQEHRNRFPGIVHDQSATGATLFIEPQAIVNLNNELRELEVAERAEIERILAELSAEVAVYYYPLINNQGLFIKLDVIFAKGKLSVMMNGMEPIMAEEGAVNIRQARHPLIPKDKVVPVNISLGSGYHSLIITGPNTGGKTVTLKTMGLLAMMAQSGLHIPVGDRTALRIFKKIYADIGDEQSIEQSLSTFSSHMNNIVEIVGSSGQDSLVLLDELGAGTDPTEGAALAIAILEALAKKGAKIMATTHYTELKKYALSSPGVENAAMEFNVETLSPTYRLITGTAGKSNAFEIAGKLGLPKTIIDQARGMIDVGSLAFEEVLGSLEEDRRLAEQEREEAIALKLAMKKQKEDLDKREEKLLGQRERILQEAREEAKDLIDEALSVSKEVQKELRELSTVESLGERNKRFDEGRKRLKDAAGKYREKLEMDAEENSNPLSMDNIEIGLPVKILSLGQKGQILTLPGESGDLLVQVGSLKVNVNIKDLMGVQESLDEKLKRASGKASYGNLYRQKSQSVSISINVQGRNLDDAIMEVDKYLDDAFMAGLDQVTIIHGRGEGILRKGLQDVMSHHKHVKSLRKGTFHEGGDGITVVKLK